MWEVMMIICATQILIFNVSQFYQIISRSSRSLLKLALLPERLIARVYHPFLDLSIWISIFKNIPRAFTAVSRIRKMSEAIVLLSCFLLKESEELLKNFEKFFTTLSQARGFDDCRLIIKILTIKRQAVVLRHHQRPSVFSPPRTPILAVNCVVNFLLSSV